MQTLTRDIESSTDLSAVAWVYDELRRSLDTAHKALRRFVKETDAMVGADVDAVDPSVLRSARAQIHQGVGALELVGLSAAAALLRASEAAVQRYVSKPERLTPLVVDDIEKASFALLDYLSRLLAGISASPLSFFPQYRVLQEIAGADRIHPADLWGVDWQWHQLPSEQGVSARQPDTAIESALEQQMLTMMRGASSKVLSRMSDIFAGLGAGASDVQIASLWKLAAAAFEAQAMGLLKLDLYSKRLASRLLSQLRIVVRGKADVSERLAHDLLFFCAQAKLPGVGQSAPRLMVVKQHWGLSQYKPVDYDSSPLGRFDPAWLVQARKRVSAAKDSWAAVAGAEMHRLTGLVEQFSLVSDSLKRLFPSGEVLATELAQAVNQTQQSGGAPTPPLAMEVATSLLYLEACLEDGELDAAGQGARVQCLAKRMSAVRKGATPEPLEPWIEDLYRRVSDRQTMGSVVHELRVTLSEVEKQIDSFFRDPNKRLDLLSVSQQFSSMRGVLSVLGMDQAAAALLRMRDEVESLASAEMDPLQATNSVVFDRLAGNLGALGFLIDMLSVQPNLVKALFVYDAQAGVLSPVMGRTKIEPGEARRFLSPQIETRLVEQAQSLALNAARDDVPLADVTRDLEHLSQEASAADQPGLAAIALKAQSALRQADGVEDTVAVRGGISEELVDFVNSASEPVALDLNMGLGASVAAAPASPSFSLDEDAEMREIFLEEAHEVLETARTALQLLESAPVDLSELTTLRRAFHTLKGSSRMVGLREFGDAAWICEQIYNTRLAEVSSDDGPLVTFTGWVLGYFADWVEEIASNHDVQYRAATVADAARALTEGTPPILLESQSALGQTIASPQLVDQGSGSQAKVDELLSRIDLSFDVSSEPALRKVAESKPSSLEFEDLPAAMSGELDVHQEDDPYRSSELRELDDSVAQEPISTSKVIDPPDDIASPPSASTTSVPLVGEKRPVWADTDFPLMLEAFEHVGTEPLPLDFQFGPSFDSEMDAGESIEMIEIDLVNFVHEASSNDGETSASKAKNPPDSLLNLEGVLRDQDPERSPVGDVAAASELGADASVLGAPTADDDQVKWVGSLRISLPLFNIYLNEADELSRRLTTELAEWSLELHQPINENAVALAHSLAGSSATVGFNDLSQLARALEHAEMRSQAIGHGTTEESSLFCSVAEEIRHLLHQFAAGFLKEADPDLLRRLAEHELTSAKRLEEAAAEEERSALDSSGGTPVAEEAVHGAADKNWTSLPAEARVDALGQGELKPLVSLTIDPKHGAVVHASAREEGEEDLDSVDAVDIDLFPIFEEEAQELLPQLSSQMRAWGSSASDKSLGFACLRTLHTLKGGARLAGAMRLGELAHRLETQIEHVLAKNEPRMVDIENLESRVDALNHTFDVLRARDAESYATAVARAEDAVLTSPKVDSTPKLFDLPPLEPVPEAILSQPDLQRAELNQIQSEGRAHTDVSEATFLEPASYAVQAESSSLAEVDWSRFATSSVVSRSQRATLLMSSQSSVRVNGPLLDRLVNEAGEVSIRRARIDSAVSQMRGSFGDLTDNLERLRMQLRDIELQGETQMSSRLEAAKAADQSFDPLEFDRFTRFQELTRMMAESVNDVATVQRTLQRTVEDAEDELAAQARLTRSMQDDLLRTRMVEFEGLSDRLYRVVRQAAKETGKQVRLDIVGGSIEVDRGVLDRMIGSFEHLLRNSVTHGVESPDLRQISGKDPVGSITVSLVQEGNEVAIEFRDDGAGLDLQRIRVKGVAMGLLAQDATPTDADLANLIFMPGFSTADKVTELAGRGIGMGVVRSEVNAMGGRIETATSLGQGTSFKLLLPLTTAVTQVVMMRCGNFTVAVPSNLVEIVRRSSAADVDKAYSAGVFTFGDRAVAFFWLGALLQVSPRSLESTGRMRLVVVVRSAQQRVAVHVDEVLGNQEVVVKNLGPQLSKMPGLAGMTLLASGGVALIYNPVALATLYGESARAATYAALRNQTSELLPPTVTESAAPAAPLVLVVDDSLTVRRVTQRLLVREGYRVVLAKDGLEALEVLSDEKPRVVLSDIEMPRMDGFDLLRNIRGDSRLSDLPVIMITSRIAQKHRDYALELGVNHYLGKPYSEDELLDLVGRYTAMSIK